MSRKVYANPLFQIKNGKTPFPIQKRGFQERKAMHIKKYKQRCEKRSLPKFKGICKTYGDLMYRAADWLSEQNDIVSVETNVPITVPAGEYTTNFFCVMADGTYKAYECSYRSVFFRPKNLALFNESMKYWGNRGIKWGIFIDAVPEE